MRDYGKVAPTFWTGETGRFLRKQGPEVQLLALYLLTCQSSNMIGLYYLPLPVLCHETGLSREGALKGLRRAFEGGFATYDEASETVFIPEMAKYQIGEKLSPKDNRHKSVLKTLEIFRKSPFFKDFIDKYKEAYHLHDVSPFEGASKPLRRGVGSQKEEQEQEQEQEQDSISATEEPSLEDDADEDKPTSTKSKKPRPRDALFDAIAEVTGVDPVTAGGSVGKVKSFLLKAVPPYTPEDVRLFAQQMPTRFPWVTTLTPSFLQQNIGLVRKPLPNQGLFNDGNGTKPVGGNVGSISRVGTSQASLDAVNAKTIRLGGSACSPGETGQANPSESPAHAGGNP